MNLPPDVERGSTSPSLANSDWTHIPGPTRKEIGHPSVWHLGLRKRRLLSQILVGLGVISVVGWVALGERDIGDVMSALQLSENTQGVSIPGIIVGSNGKPFPIGDTAKLAQELEEEPTPVGSEEDVKDAVEGEESVEGATEEPVQEAVEEEPPHADKLAEYRKIKPQQWGLNLNPEHLTGGLLPWPTNPSVNESDMALSELGHFADNIYNHGSQNLQEYRGHLRQFINLAWPKDLRPALLKGLYHFTSYSPSSEEEDEEGHYDWDTEKNIWQTDKDLRHADSSPVATWKGDKAKNEGWQHDLMTDQDADKWVKKTLSGSRIKDVWDNLPSGILRSDTLRYLLLLLQGGIYSDTDTNLLKAPSWWGRSPHLWKGGDGWLSDEQKEELKAGTTIEQLLGRPSVIVGVEADVGNRVDWFDWWPRPIQIVQWTMATTPTHPIALSALLRILHATSHAISWAHQNARVVNLLKDQGRYEDAKGLSEVNVMNEPKNGGPVGVMAWTGPGVWTDAVLEYLRVKYDMKWVDLKDIREPLRVGDVVILPVTGFSPGVGNFGSQGKMHPQAMSEHLFRGSWKNN